MLFVMHVSLSISTHRHASVRGAASAPATPRRQGAASPAANARRKGAAAAAWQRQAGAAEEARHQAARAHEAAALEQDSGPPGAQEHLEHPVR